VERATGTLGAALLVELIGEGKGVGIDFDDGIDRWAGFVHGVDARQILVDQTAGGELAAGQAALEDVKGELAQFESGGAGFRCLGLRGQPFRDGHCSGSGGSGLQELAAAEWCGRTVGWHRFPQESERAV